MRRLAVFASGNGTNFEAIVSACERGELAAGVVLLVCDRPGARVAERAAAHGVEAFVFSPQEYASKVFGVTVHWVDATLDGGRIIAQRAFGYEGGDAAELEAKIHAVEYPLYIDTIRKLLEDERLAKRT